MKKLFAALASAALVTTVFAQTGVPASAAHPQGETTRNQAKADKEKHVAQPKASKTNVKATHDAKKAQAKADKAKVDGQADSDKAAASAHADKANKQ